MGLLLRAVSNGMAFPILQLPKWMRRGCNPNGCCYSPVTLRWVNWLFSQTRWRLYITSTEIEPQLIQFSSAVVVLFTKLKHVEYHTLYGRSGTLSKQMLSSKATYSIAHIYMSSLQHRCSLGIRLMTLELLASCSASWPTETPTVMQEFVFDRSIAPHFWVGVSMQMQQRRGLFLFFTLQVGGLSHLASCDHILSSN